MFEIVTTFHQRGYDRYGHRFLDTMDRYLPDKMLVHVYYENMDKPKGFSERIIFKDFAKFCGEKQSKFEILAKPHELSKSNVSHGDKFLFQASRFAHKYYACEHAINNINSRYLIWIDADVVACKTISLNFFEKTIQQGCYWSRLSRGKKRYPECGYMVWDREHKLHKKFWDYMSLLYDEGNCFKLKEWHDSYLWWEAEKQINQQESTTIGYNLSGNAENQWHPFVAGPLGEYFDHHKGKRKLKGKSPERKKYWS
jgi:hypothetical protein